MKRSVYLFVYGTLRKHERNHHYLNKAKKLYDQAWVYGTLYDTGFGYPALSLNGNDRVFGELFELSIDDLPFIDQLEDYHPARTDSLYTRVTEQIWTDDGPVEGVVYVTTNKSIMKERIPSGDWKVHQFLLKKPDFVSYFAYGSCMDHERFQKANVDHFFQHVIGTGRLHNYSMKYTFPVEDGGRADIVEDGGITEGIVYHVPYEGVKYLFEREGVELGWYRPAFVDVTINGEQHVDVLTFIVNNKQNETCPPVHYAREILRGAYGYVSAAYMKQLKERLHLLGMSMDQIEQLI
jgi:gamma-glutamylcyclotransferase (GGCT)/AIG2-like uncharacterized protein YtfP